MLTAMLFVFMFIMPRRRLFGIEKKGKESSESLIIQKGTSDAPEKVLQQKDRKEDKKEKQQC